MKKLFNPNYACLLIAVVVVAVGLRPPADGPSVRTQNASGEVQLTNSKDGSAILQTGNLAPGQQVTGTVQLANTGPGNGDLDLTQADLPDTPGPGLGALSGALQLSIRDVTNPGSPVNVFSGAPSALGNKALGKLAPGRSRTYSFTATLPSSGVTNVAGSAMSARYVWTLTGPGGSGGSGGSGGGIAGGGSGGAPSAMPVTVRVNVKKALKKGLITVTVKCGEACKMNAYAMAKGKPAVRTRLKSGSVKVVGKQATIKLKLSKAAKRALAKRLKKKKALPLTVTVKAQDPRGAWKTITVKVKVKRGKRR